ncbi:MAG: FMN-binding protein [Clostridiaceae bacterium]|nr:FMN-binding protein [Clostridiaceae bacterium]
MKKVLLTASALVLASGLALTGCTATEELVTAQEDVIGEDIVEETTTIYEESEMEGYEDGRYRGIYGDGGEQQVSVQFDLEDNVISNVSFRHLYYSGTDYRKLEEGEALYPILQQHEQIAEYLEGKPVSAIYDLYTPGDFIEDMDGFTGASIRGSKIFSAIKDGLNRGLYSPAGDFSRTIGEYEDGRYRGIYGDGGEQQVSVQFDLEDNAISNVSFRHLYYSGIDYRKLEEGEALYPILQQHEQIIEYLEGKPLSAIFDLHTPGDFIEDMDGFTGASIRGNKVFSGIKDGLNRGLYSPAGDFSRTIGEYEDGRYRGIYEDGGEQQVSIQFNVEGNRISNIRFRHLYYSGTDYRKLEEGEVLYPILQQHEQIIEYLEGKPLSAIFDLHTPGDFIEDIDTFTGATIRGNKVFSSIVDGLNRGLY